MRFKLLAVAAIVLFSTWSLYTFIFWGRPVLFQVQISERVDSKHDGVIDTWRLGSSRGNTPADVVEFDTDGDGRVDRLQVSNPKVEVLDVSGREQSGRRKLAVCLDGVPYEDMDSLW